jgi:hypothetical protein
MVPAHAGHWALQVLYAFPVLLVVGFIVFDRIKRRGEADEQPEQTEPPRE